MVALSDLFDSSVSSRVPAVAVLSGVTGFGKSTIAADFCHLNRHLYEKVVWMDCRDTALIEGKVRDVLRRLGIEFELDDDLPDLFRTALGNLGGPVIVVFDGARDREQIERFVPTSGCGFVLVTSTNNTTWWSSAVRRQIGAFSAEEAMQCFASHADVAVEPHRDAIIEVIDRLGRVPLAIAMAGLYFRDSSDDVAALKADYFARLDALDDPAFRPDSFDRTAFAAVRLAVDRLGQSKAGSTEQRLQAQQLVFSSSFLAPDLIPFNMILQTVRAENTVDLAAPPRPMFADLHHRNVIMATLQTQTIARRRNYVEQPGQETPASDTLNIHPLVHEILRTIHTTGVPQRDLIGLLAGLMGCIYGWLEEMRAEGHFFPVDQLLLHSEFVLSAVDELALTDAPDRELYVYRCAQAFLRCEAANGYSSRGQYETSVSMIERVLGDVHGLALSPRAQIVVAKAAADALTDVLIGDLGVERAIPIAHRELEELGKLEAIDQKAAGEMVYLCATEAAGALARFQAPEADDLAQRISEVAGRQSRSASATGLMEAITADLKARRFSSALRRIDQARQVAPTAPNRLFLDFHEATARLHLLQFDEAADSIERIVGADTGHHMEYAFRSLYAALDTGLTLEAAKWSRSRAARRLASLHAEVRARGG